MPGESQQSPNKEPDPSVLTTEQLDKAIENLEKLFKSRAETLKAEYDGKLTAIDEKLKAMESLRIEQKTDAKISIDAALSSAEKLVARQDSSNQTAIDKSEKATSESITKLQDLFKTTTDGLQSQQTELKAGLAEVVSARLNSKEHSTEQRLSTNQMLTFVSVGLVLVFGILGLVLKLTIGG